MAVLILRENRPSVLTQLVFAAPSALFPLMALFLWLDADRYRAYLPLFAAGKCIVIFTLLGWSIASRQVTMIGSFLGAAVFGELVLLSGDLLSLAAVFLIINDMRKNSEIPVVADTAGTPNTEDKVCE